MSGGKCLKRGFARRKASSQVRNGETTAATLLPPPVFTVDFRASRTWAIPSVRDILETVLRPLLEPAETFRGVRRPIPITSDVAHPPVIRIRVVAGLEAVQLVVVFMHLDAAARAATGADGVVRLHEPDPLLIQEVGGARLTTGQRSLTLPGEMVVDGEAGEGIDFPMRSPVNSHRIPLHRRFRG